MELKILRHEKELFGRKWAFEVGKVAWQADSAVWAQCGDTVVLVTVVVSKKPAEDVDFLPLTVHYEEKMYAAGKIPGGFIKREGKPSDHEVLVARLIDRPIRPLIPNTLRHEVQIIATVLSADPEVSPDIVAMNGASLALCLSGLPFNGPIGAVRVGLGEEGFTANPPHSQVENGDLNLVVVAKEPDRVVMIEAGAKEIPEDEMLEAVKFGRDIGLEMIAFQKEFIKLYEERFGEIPKLELTFEEPPKELVEEIESNFGQEIFNAIYVKAKKEREMAIDAIKEKIVEVMKEKYGEEDERTKLAPQAFSKVVKKIFRKRLLEENVRPDGRKDTEIRPVHVEVGLLPRAHGSGLFIRGETEVLSVVTLGAREDVQIVESIMPGEEFKRYMHHYNFPPYCTGEVKPLRAPSRREIGHGALAERALVPVLPSEDEFPYTIRVVSEVLSSNGSTSMASTCGSTLALMDAGVPIKAPVAGISIGLVKEEKGYRLLTDIIGFEDAHGDMDFKVAGTRKGITAIQLDIKIDGLTVEMIREVFERARQARLYILDRMQEAIEKPRETISPYAPRIKVLHIDPIKVPDLIGPGGRMIKKIIDETGANFNIEPDGTVYIVADSEEKIEKALEYVHGITADVAVGDVFLGKITRVEPYGLFIEIAPGKIGLLHKSQMPTRPTKPLTELYKVGEEILVKVVNIDSLGRISFTRNGLERRKR